MSQITDKEYEDIQRTWNRSQTSREGFVAVFDKYVQPLRDRITRMERERRDAILSLRTICETDGDNDWPDGLYLTDILRNHLANHLNVVKGNPIDGKLADYQITTIRELRANYPQLQPYLDCEIVFAYRNYCEMNHAAGWTDTDLDKFIKYAFTPPIDEGKV